MSIVIVIAHSEHTAQTAWVCLQSAGLAPAQPSRREQLTPQQVQALMIKTTQQRRSAHSAHSAALDKIWTELATDLVLANVDATRYGWWQTLDAHTPAFWQRFDPDTRFVLVFEDPTAQTAQALTDILKRDTTPIGDIASDMASALQAWHDQHSQLLDTFFALGADAQLVHTSQLAQTAQWLSLSAQGPEGSLEPGNAPASAPMLEAGLQHHLLQPFVAAHPAVESLWPQLQAAAQGPCPDPAPEQQATRQAVGQWLQLQRQSQATARRLEQIAEHNEQLQTRLGDQAAAMQTESTAKAQAQQHLQTLQQAQEQNKRQLQDAQEEGKLLLAQLHQVQEELESHFLKLQEETKAKAAAQQQLQTLEQAQQQNKRQLKDAQEEGELLLAQLHQVQEELENYFLKYQSQRQQYQTVVDFWQQHPPTEIWVDMRRTPDGAGWYEAEADGRWSGPTTESTVALPPLAEGDYLLELHIADAMAPEMVAGLQLSAVLADGETVPVELVHEFGPAESRYPMVSAGMLCLPATQAGWQLRLALPEVISPAAHGGNDTRHLGLRLQGLRLTRRAHAAEDAEAQA